MSHCWYFFDGLRNTTKNPATSYYVEGVNLVNLAFIMYSDYRRFLNKIILMLKRRILHQIRNNWDICFQLCKSLDKWRRRIVKMTFTWQLSLTALLLGLSFYQLFTDLPVNYFYRFTGKLWLVKMVKEEVNV
jgi:hypothetical protein